MTTEETENLREMKEEVLEFLNKYRANPNGPEIFIEDSDFLEFVDELLDYFVQVKEEMESSKFGIF